MYTKRQRWVPFYLKPTLWAGMSTTQRSESTNTFFDGFVHSKTSLKQFVVQYGRALRCKAEKEFHADTKSFTKMISCVRYLKWRNKCKDYTHLQSLRNFKK
ncbi:unnamed protein product [Cuscuta epithymum]|uniref:Protein FAR1-RELATED SEQUENCE n=1 Tax=Cuscuta epithymum TaxID=186058 RepID=A0AAV0D1D8_9ASTE|nr:unnamed protein product [Cuscuta epithymum]